MSLSVERSVLVVVGVLGGIFLFLEDVGEAQELVAFHVGVVELVLVGGQRLQLGAEQLLRSGEGLAILADFLGAAELRSSTFLIAWVGIQLTRQAELGNCGVVHGGSEEQHVPLELEAGVAFVEDRQGVSDLAWHEDHSELLGDFLDVGLDLLVVSAHEDLPGEVLFEEGLMLKAGVGDEDILHRVSQLIQINCHVSDELHEVCLIEGSTDPLELKARVQTKRNPY